MFTRATMGMAVVMVVMLLFGGGAPVAYATPILIEHNHICFSGTIDSDATIDSSLLDASIEYWYDAGVLTMIIDNETAIPNAYTLSVLNFNTSDDVTGLSILNDGALSNTSLSANVTGGSMGTFDWSFDLGQGNDGITAGNSETVTFSVTGSNLSTADFFYGLSTSPGDGNGHFLSTIHFTRGPAGASDWVTPGVCVVPEPASMCLLGMGIAGFVVRKLRNRASQ